MTNDPMLEKWIEAAHYLDGDKVPCIAVHDLRTFMAGRRIVEDVPIDCEDCEGHGFLTSLVHGAYPCETCNGHGKLYAAPGDTEAGNV